MGGRVLLLLALSSVLGSLTPAREARAGVDESAPSLYCIYGDGNGVGWTWTVEGHTILGDPASFSGSVAGVTGTAFDVADAFVDSIEAADKGEVFLYYVRRIPTPANCAPTPAAAFAIAGSFLVVIPDPFPKLFVEPAGGGAEVEVVGPDISAAIEFNPRIWQPLPEPDRAIALGAGALALLALAGTRCGARA